MTRRRALTVVLPVAVLLVVLGIYMSIDVQIHWFLHLFLGGTAALLVATVVGLVTGRFAQALPVIAVGAVINAIPDVLYLYFHVAHRPWMDIFQWHIEAHFMPGFPESWYLIFILALGAYYIAQVVPPAKPVLRIAPVGVVVVAINIAVIDAHEHVPAGIMTHHAGYLTGWISPVIAIACLVLLLGSRPSGGRIHEVRGF